MDDHLAPPLAADTLRLVTRLRPEIAFSRAVGHLMVRPAFAGAPFGHVARCLAGQVNRGDYAFAVRGAATVGFAGWACVERATAEDWVAGRRGFTDDEAGSGDCVVLNFWQADAPEVTRFMIERLAGAVPATCVYAKRHYPDGRVRPLRLDLGRRRKEVSTGP